MFREYKYFFFEQNMDIKKIKRACRQYVGLHDFSNFCKKDEALMKDDFDEATMFLRRIYSYKVVKV